MSQTRPFSLSGIDGLEFMAKIKVRKAVPGAKRPAAKKSPSPTRKKRISIKNPGSVSRSKESPKPPITLEDARREMQRVVCQNVGAITQAVVNDALQGKYLSARFLFKTAGLCDAKESEPEGFAERESLARLLLQRWQLTASNAGVTEVPEVTAAMAPGVKAAVES